MNRETTTAQVEATENTARRGRGRPRGSNVDGVILKGAATAFATHGYDACRVEDILRACGVSRTHFYRHFSNKEHVYSQLVIRQLDYAERKLGEVHAEFTPDEPLDSRLRKLIRRKVEIALESGPFLAVMIRDLSRNDKHQDLWEAKHRFFCDLLSGLLIEAGCVRPDPLLVAGVICGAEHILVGLSQCGEGQEAIIDRGIALIAPLVSATVVMPAAG